MLVVNIGRTGKLERMMRKHNRGFTLIELLVVLGIGTTIAGVMSMTIASVMRLVPLNNDRVVTLRQVQNTGFWISRDVQMARIVTIGPPGGELLVHLEWDEYDDSNNRVDYVFIDDELRRQLNGDTPGMLIAEYILAPPDSGFEQDATFDTKYILTVKATKDEAVVERTYEMWQRITVPE